MGMGMLARIQTVMSVTGLAAAGLLSATPAVGLGITHLYDLADFSGTVPYTDARLVADRAHDELYVLGGDIVRVFNGSGMEIYRFGQDAAFGLVRDLAVDDAGDILVLSLDTNNPQAGPVATVVRCDYRGEPKARIALTNLPPEFANIVPNRLFYRDNGLLLVGTNQMLAVETDTGGRFQKGYDLGHLAGVPDKDRPDTEIIGFTLGADGRMVFSVPVMFKIFLVMPDGTVDSFGRTGSAPGMFGIVAGVELDEHGNVFVADKLRSVVMVFDKTFRFVEEFGTRGNKPENLIRPSDVVLGRAGKLYVTQSRNRGVSVFSVSSD